MTFILDNIFTLLGGIAFVGIFTVGLILCNMNSASISQDDFTINENTKD